MASIIQTLNRLFPLGTNPGARGSLRFCPAWPPDLFAVAATLLETSSAYAELPCTTGWNAGVYLFNNSYLREVKRAGTEWATTGNAPQIVRNLWDELRRLGNHEVTIRSLPIIVRLMTIADEASIGIDFPPYKRTAVFSTIVLGELTEPACSVPKCVYFHFGNPSAVA
jgi:hypothetical protein